MKWESFSAQNWFFVYNLVRSKITFRVYFENNTDCDPKYSEDDIDIINMLFNLVHNIYVEFGENVFQQIRPVIIETKECVTVL